MQALFDIMRDAREYLRREAARDPWKKHTKVRNGAPRAARDLLRKRKVRRRIQKASRRANRVAK